MRNLSLPTNDYHFFTHSRVRGAIETVAEILGDPAQLVRWWPAVYLNVQEVTPGSRDGAGKVIDLYTKGWLPYTLRWQFQVTKVDWPCGFELAAAGDFVGRGIWSLAQDGEWVNVNYDWRIRAEKPLLAWLSPLLKPVFSANHRWAMRQGERSLQLELARRQAPDAAARQQVPAPPGPTFAWLLPKHAPEQKPRIRPEAT